MIRFLQTPGPVKKYVLGGLLLLMTVSMVWYLVPSGNNYTFGSPAKGVVAKVGDAEVTADEVRTTALESFSLYAISARGRAPRATRRLLPQRPEAVRRLERCPPKAEVEGSNPFGSAT